MKILTVRRLGDSNVVVLPREFEKLGYRPGERVMVEALPSGDVLIRPAEHLRAAMDDMARQVVEEDREALDILDAHDRGKRSKPNAR
jgi:antitoxin component of MazEF toxin-antitoxin module